MISGTITDASGRTLSGQTVAAFWNSVRHAKPLSVGINCALGAAGRPHIELNWRRSHRNLCQRLPRTPGCPDPLSNRLYDETPAMTSGFLKEFAQSSLVNIVGGAVARRQHIGQLPWRWRRWRRGTLRSRLRCRAYDTHLR